MLRMLRVLLVEDSPLDAELIVHQLRGAGFAPDWHRVDNEADYTARLGSDLDVILSDYSIPQFSGMRALQILKERGLEIPFILVSGAIGEDVAVRSIKEGATDYLLKDRLGRLGPAIENALVQARLARERRQAQDELRESERTARAVVDALTAHIAILDEDGCILAVNARWREFARQNDAVLISVCEGANYLAACDDAPRFGHPEAAVVAAGIRDVLAGRNHEFVAEYPSHSPKEQRWFIVRVTPFLGEGPKRAVVSHENITKRKRAEIELRESECRERDRSAELAAILDAVPTPVFISHGPDCLRITGNRAADDLLRNDRGAEASRGAPKEIRPRHFRAVKDGRELRTDELPAQRASRGFVVRDFEFRMAFEDGTTREVISHGEPLRDERGEPRGAINVLVDITERKRTEAALREKDEQLSLITSMTPVALTQCSRDWRFVFANQAYAEIAGLMPAQIIGRPIVEILGEAGCAAIRPHVEKVLRGEAVECVEDVPFAAGGVRHLGVAYRPHINELGEVLGWFASITDITDRKRLEREILEISAREQRRIGQDLHDDVCQWLTATEFLASALAKELQRSPAKAKLARNIVGTIRQAHARARTLAHAMAPAIIEEAGLAEVLRDLAASAGEMFRIRCLFEGPEIVYARDSASALHLYRIAQEAITNAVRHGRAREVRILLEADEDRVTMRIRDDGSGIAELQAAKDGMGLRTMRYRAETIGATLEIRANASGGAEIACSFPTKS